MPIVCRAWKACIWTISPTQLSSGCIGLTEPSLVGGLNSLLETVLLSPIYLPDFMDWGEKKPVALKIW